MLGAAGGLFHDFGHPREIDASVRAQLADSLVHVVAAAAGHIDVDRGRFDRAIAAIHHRQQDPGVFARYFDLIFAINANDLAKANTLLAELIEGALTQASFAIVSYSREELGTDYDRFADLLFAEFSRSSPMASPPEQRSTASRQALRDAIAIVSRVDPRIQEEIEAFLTRIYMALPSTNPEAKRFGGVTSLLVWGASFINIEFYKTQWDAVQFLVHEITHSLLFGLSCDQPLVKNPSKESYPSPLRAEPRPMDGIFHATLVCARLATFNRAWLDSGLLPASDRDLSERAISSNVRSFHDGLAVINQHGKLTEKARQLLDLSCRAVPVFA